MNGSTTFLISDWHKKFIEESKKITDKLNEIDLIPENKRTEACKSGKNAHCCNIDKNKLDAGTCPKLSGISPTITWIIERILKLAWGWMAMSPSAETGKKSLEKFLKKALCVFFLEKKVESAIQDATITPYLDDFTNYIVDGIANAFNSIGIFGTIEKKDKCGTGPYCILHCAIKTFVDNTVGIVQSRTIGGFCGGPDDNWAGAVTGQKKDFFNRGIRDFLVGTLMGLIFGCTHTNIGCLPAAMGFQPSKCNVEEGSIENGCECYYDSDCISHNCCGNSLSLSKGVCTPVIPNGGDCRHDGNCEHGYCEGNYLGGAFVGTCVGESRANGAICNEDKDCWSGNCSNFRCKPDCDGFMKSCDLDDIDVSKGLPSDMPGYMKEPNKWKNPLTGSVEDLVCEHDDSCSTNNCSSKFRGKCELPKKYGDSCDDDRNCKEPHLCIKGKCRECTNNNHCTDPNKPWCQEKDGNGNYVYRCAEKVQFGWGCGWDAWDGNVYDEDRCANSLVCGIANESDPAKQIRIRCCNKKKLLY